MKKAETLLRERAIKELAKVFVATHRDEQQARHPKSISAFHEIFFTLSLCHLSFLTLATPKIARIIKRFNIKIIQAAPRLRLSLLRLRFCLPRYSNQVR